MIRNAKFFELVQGRASSENFTPIKEVALETLESIQKAAQNNSDVTGISTGFIDLDYRTAGLQPSDLILIAARPSMGKTAFALNIAENVAMINHIPTAIFSLEMSKVQLAKRLVAMNSKVDSQRIRIGELEDDEWQRLPRVLLSSVNQRFISMIPAAFPSMIYEVNAVN